MQSTLVAGLVTAGALAVGAVIGATINVPDRVSGVVTAVGAGSLMAAATLDLFGPALRQADQTLIASIWFSAGAVAFYLVDSWLDRFADPTATEKATDRKYAYLLVAAVVLDGIPENVALGLRGVEQAVGLGVAIAVSNLPEAMMGARAARRGGLGRVRTMVVWLAAALALFGSVAAGMWLSPSAGTAPWLAFAGGAVVAAIADTLVPLAFRHGGSASILGVAGGFLIGSLAGM
jgi:zinc transporter, ZIP family